MSSELAAAKSNQPWLRGSRSLPQVGIITQLSTISWRPVRLTLDSHPFASFCKVGAGPTEEPCA